MKEFTPVWAWVVLGVALAISFCVDASNTLPGGSIDLRNRITGTRTMMADIPPYHYKWHKGELPEYCDPFNNPTVPVSKVTATPTSLLLLAPLAALDYRSAQLLWLLLQWALLLGTAWLWLRKCETLQQWAIVAASTAGFTYTAAWRLHAERGQAYVLLLFIFAGWLLLTLDSKKGNGFLAGCIAGLLIALRPPFLLLAPFLALHRRGQLPGVAVGLLLSAGLPMLINHDAWPDYFSGMHDYAGIYTSFIDVPFQAQAYPDTIEGIPLDTLAHFAVIPFADFSVFNLLHLMGLNSFPNLPVLLVIVAPFGIWLWLTRKLPTERLLPALAAWFFLVDLFLPSFRNNYNDVLILNIVALGVLATPRIPWGTWPCLIALPVGWAVYGLTLHPTWMINAPSFFFTVGAILFLFLPKAVPQRKSR
jgi:hypothetical protein